MDLRSHTELCRLAIYTPDGLYGPVEDVIIEDGSWRITHFVCLSDGETPGRDVLIPVELIDSVNFAAGRLLIDRTRNQLRRSLALAVTQTTTRLNGLRMNRALNDRPIYVAGISRGEQPQPLTPGQPADAQAPAGISPSHDALERLNDSPHYRRGADLIDYHLKSQDGVIGPIQELLFDMSDLQLHHIIVEVFMDQQHSKMILLPLPDLAVWEDRRLHVAASTVTIGEGPSVLTAHSAVSEDEMKRADAHFGRHSE